MLTRQLRSSPKNNELVFMHQAYFIDGLISSLSFHSAIGDVMVLQELLAGGADIYSLTSPELLYPIEIAVKHHNYEFANAILDQGFSYKHQVYARHNSWNLSIDELIDRACVVNNAWKAIDIATKAGKSKANWLFQYLLKQYTSCLP